MATTHSWPNNIHLNPGRGHRRLDGHGGRKKCQRRGQETPVSIRGGIVNVTNGGGRATEGQNPQNHGMESSGPSPSCQRKGVRRGRTPPERKEGGQAVPKAARACQGPCCGDGNCNAAWPKSTSRKERRRPESPCKRA